LLPQKLATAREKKETKFEVSSNGHPKLKDL